MDSFFGTDGIRTQVGTAPLTVATLTKLGLAIGFWIIKTYGQNATVAIAYDTRISADFIKTGIMHGLIAQGLNVADAGVLSTPALACALNKQTKFSCGIMISASHNLYQDNGIKIMNQSGQKLSATDEKIICDAYQQYLNTVPEFRTCGSITKTNVIKKIYTSVIKQLHAPQFLSGKKIVLDCAHGAVYAIAPEIFSAYGATIIPLHTRPDGTNINYQAGSTNPKKLVEAVKSHNADAGFAFDGDADRVIAVSKNGQLKDGDDLLALLSQHPDYREQDTIVGTLMSNEGLAQWCAQHQKQFVRTAVGDKYVLQALLERNALLGGEPSGHVILRDKGHSSDGILVALKVLETIQLTDNWQMETFAKWPCTMINTPIAHRRSLDSQDIQEIINQYKKKSEESRIIVRYSGTEPVLRVMVEQKNQENAEVLCRQLSLSLKEILG